MQAFTAAPCGCKDMVDLLLYSKGCLNRKIKLMQRWAVHHAVMWCFIMVFIVTE